MKTSSFSIVAIFLFSFVLSLTSCSEKANECDGGCTEEFRSVMVKVTDPEGNPIVLDAYTVTGTETERDFTAGLTEGELEVMRNIGTYQIISDEFVQELRQQQVEVAFSGFIDGEEVVSETYLVRFDCCHVYHVSGELELVVEGE